LQDVRFRIVRTLNGDQTKRAIPNKSLRAWDQFGGVAEKANHHPGSIPRMGKYEFDAML
jgi:hypothetical protein